ncbi:MAG: RNA pyrophosphohydrolase [Rickettsiaceae bacterium]|nr:RNA pyrophosphohydrolase [Rickettsiaceae bacterium]
MKVSTKYTNSSEFQKKILGSSGYRPAVGLMIINKNNEIFLGNRIDSKHTAWQMPQGGINLGETPSQAAMREMLEEIGSNNANIVAESRYWYCYDIPEKSVSQLWGGKYCGQNQKWFLIRFEGNDDEINIQTQIPEFSQWQWVAPEKLNTTIAYFKRRLYGAVMREFKPLLKKYATIEDK